MHNKKKDKTINDNSAIIDRIRREYAELYKENENLKLTIQNYERCHNDQRSNNYNDYNKRQKYIPKKDKRKRRYQKPYNNSSSETEDKEIIISRRKKRREKKVYDDDDVDSDANEVHKYYEPSSPTDNDGNDDYVDDSEKANVKTVKIIQKPTKNKKKDITKSIKV